MMQGWGRGRGAAGCDVLRRWGAGRAQGRCGQGKARRGRGAGGVQAGCKYGAGGVQAGCRWGARQVQAGRTARPRPYLPTVWLASWRMRLNCFFMVAAARAPLTRPRAGSGEPLPAPLPHPRPARTGPSRAEPGREGPAAPAPPSACAGPAAALRAPRPALHRPGRGGAGKCSPGGIGRERGPQPAALPPVSLRNPAAFLRHPTATPAPPRAQVP